MGSASSMQKAEKNLYWTAEEVKENEDCMKLQKEAAEYIIEQLYFGVPVKYGKKSANPTSAIWFEIDPDIINNTESDIKKSVLRSVPSGVLCDSKGNIKAIFALTEVSYEFCIADFRRAAAFAKHHEPLHCPPPEPPFLKDSDMCNIWIEWKLPLPPGIVQQVEVQYSQTKDALQVSNVFNWQGLVSKTWEYPEFSCHCLSELLPGTSYVFRLRYRTHLGFSEFSQPSHNFTTSADKPSAPEMVCTGGVFSDSAQLFWTAPLRDNGRPVEGYILQGKAAGDEFTVLFRGFNMNFFVSDLLPQSGYTFQVACWNSVGTSKFCSPVSILTTSMRSASSAAANSQFVTMAAKCKDAWIEQWDPKGEKYFYFNRISGVRQVEKPAVLDGADSRSDGSSTTSAAVLTPDEKRKQEEIQFRTKRFRLTRLIHRQAINTAPAPTPGATPARNSNVGQPNAPLSPSTPDRAAGAKQEPFNVTLRRDCLLSDSFSLIGLAPLASLRKRLKITYEGEAGIDSGGLSKETFLLLSRELIEFGGPKNKKWLVVQGGQGKGASTRLSNLEGYSFVENMTASTSKIVKKGTTTTVAAGFTGHKALEALPQFNEVSFAKFLGRVLGKALYDRQLVDVPLSPLLRWHMTGSLNTTPVVPSEKEVPTESKIITPTKPKNPQKPGESAAKAMQEDIDRMLSIIRMFDKELHSSLRWILDNDITGILFETFSVEVPSTEPGCPPKVIALCAGGEQRDVIEDNKQEYVFLLTQWKTSYSLSHLLTPFLAGFHELVPQDALDAVGGLTIGELDLMLNGRPVMNVEELRAYCIYQGSRSRTNNSEGGAGNNEVPFGEGHKLVIWLWQLVREMKESERRDLLFFFTGTARVPLDGFDPPLNITEGVDMSEDSLPRAHTCFNQLVIPQYSTYKMMCSKIRFAIQNTEGFDFS